MTAPGSAAIWTMPDFDEHERVEVIHDRASGLTAIVALHSTHRGPGAGGTRFWHYPQPLAAVRDALRLSRGMSYKNALAGLPLGGGKAVVLLDEQRTKTPEMLAAFGDAVEALGGAYVTAEDVGASVADMEAIHQRTEHVCGLPAQPGQAGGDPGPYTAQGIFLGIKAAVQYRLGGKDMDGVHVAVQGCGSVGSGVARLLAGEGARVTLADIDHARAEVLAAQLGGSCVSTGEIMEVGCDVFSPNALGAILDDATIPQLDCTIVAGGANNQLARAEHGEMLRERGILYAPDYVINAGGIINVGLEYLARRAGETCSSATVMERIGGIARTLTTIWEESERSGTGAHEVADRMAREAIGRGE
ncbi:Leu/Phe/Val dehydrogenase [Aurantiacibacter suaedae]|uniref:Leu/Phe/Val dehydrogenase n=1 Tax=Aurantiacibacter suaedae TaxID=2545755 RepID=UPI0010F49DD0|nr:Glu/Leu/Phe/Val dehydrogenase dimerization domain-containing protein [Aurantiacibacter suaedae]